MLSFISKVFLYRLEFLRQRSHRQFCGSNILYRTFNHKLLSQTIDKVKYHKQSKSQRDKYRTSSSSQMLQKSPEFKLMPHILFPNGKSKNVQFLECLKHKFRVIESDIGGNKTTEKAQKRGVFDDINDVTHHLVERFQGAEVLLINYNCIFRTM